MDEQRLIPVEARSQWEDALEGIRHGYWHTWGACRSVAVNTGLPVQLYVARRGALRVVCPVMVRSWNDVLDVTTPAGFSGFAANAAELPADFPAEWGAFMHRRGIVCAYIAMHPLFGPAWPDPEIAGTTLYLLDLRPPEQEWLRQIDSNRRRSIRAWEKLGTPAVRDRAGLTDFLVEHHAQFMRAANASPASFYTPAALRGFCADPQVFLVGAEDDGGICAAAVFGATQWAAELLFHVSVREGRQHAAALMWLARRHFADLGLQFVNLGGGIRPGDAVAQAKLRYRPAERHLRIIKQVFDPQVYRDQCIAAGQAPDDLSGYFPAYRKSAAHSPAVTA